MLLYECARGSHPVPQLEVLTAGADGEQVDAVASCCEKMSLVCAAPHIS